MRTPFLILLLLLLAPVVSAQAGERWAGTVRTVAPTRLRIEPSEFSLKAGENMTLTAILTDKRGNPLAGKRISWSADAGELSSADSTTDSSGRATVTYLAPSAAVVVKVRAFFEGDPDYFKSEGEAVGRISPGRQLPYLKITALILLVLVLSVIYLRGKSPPPPAPPNP
ncbi:MAG: Ig-like domain-containing protein [Candidatus Hadarchaeales archaeon]